MKLKAIILALALSLPALGGIAWANTGLQNTPYSTNTFSAVFNGMVDAGAASRSTDGKSTNYTYVSTNTDGTIAQGIIVRFVDYDISVDYTSSDFYANDDTSAGTIGNRSTGTYQGHPFTYTARFSVDNGVNYIKRTRYIIVNAREVIFIVQYAPDTNNSYGDRDQWMDFEDSLTIK